MRLVNINVILFCDCENNQILITDVFSRCDTYSEYRWEERLCFWNDVAKGIRKCTWYVPNSLRYEKEINTIETQYKHH